jgi:hypothetical protein
LPPVINNSLLSFFTSPVKCSLCEIVIAPLVEPLTVISSLSPVTVIVLTDVSLPSILLVPIKLILAVLSEP